MLFTLKLYEEHLFFQMASPSFLHSAWSENLRFFNPWHGTHSSAYGISFIYYKWVSNGYKWMDMQSHGCTFLGYLLYLLSGMVFLWIANIGMPLNSVLLLLNAMSIFKNSYFIFAPGDAFTPWIHLGK